jgi:hypothetical protein
MLIYFVIIIHSRSEHIYYAALAVHTDQLTRWLVLVHALGLRNAAVRQWLSECGWPVTVAKVHRWMNCHAACTSCMFECAYKLHVLTI